MEQIISGLEFFQKGGFVMYVLLACSIFVLAVGVERWLYFRQNDTGRAFAHDFADRAAAKDYAGAIALAQKGQGALAQVLRDAIAGAGQAKNELTALMEIRSGVALSHFRRRLNYLSVIVTLAPLLGLLGTISGMIRAFSVFGAQASQAKGITGGVGEALIATAFGLCVAILSLLIHSYFSQRLEDIVTDMEQCFSSVEMRQEGFAQASGGAGKAGDGHALA